jgi:hypothetical protein
MGEEFDMGDTRAIDGRRGPVELDIVADGDDIDVSMDGGAVGRCEATNGDASGIPYGDIGRGMLAGDLSARPSGDMGNAT